VSAGLSVAHLGPRSAWGNVLLLNWLTRVTLGWLVALPLITAVGASGLGALPQADRALFEGGGLWLVELAFRETHALSGGLRAVALLGLAALALRTPITAVLFFAAFDAKATLSVASRRALGGFRRFLGLSVLELLGRALLLTLTVLAAHALESISHPANEALAELAPLASYLLGLLLLAGFAIFCDCCRAVSVQSPRLGLGAVLADASSFFRACALQLLGSYLFYVGFSVLLLSLGARLVEALDVGRAGALRVVGVCLVHQNALLGLCLLQWLWLRRLMSLTQPGPDSPSALR
jgi:hypothetical protein